MRLLTTFCLAFLAVSSLFAQETSSLADLFNVKLAEMQSSDTGKVRDAQQGWQRVCFEAGATGQEKKRVEAVTLMADALSKGHLKDTTNAWLIRQLGRLDNGDNAKLVGSFFGHKERTVCDEAVWALANISSDSAGKVIRDLLAKEDNANKKLALQNALNHRTVRTAVDLPKLDDILKSLEAADLRACDHVLPDLFWLVDVKFSDVANYKERFVKLKPQAQSLLMNGLVARRDRSAIPLAFNMIESDNEQTRLAGYRALGPLGNAETLPLLLDKIGEEGDLGNTIRASLACLNFDGADKMLIDAYEKAVNNDIKIALLNIYSRRKGMIAAPIFEAGLKSDDERIRLTSIGSLADVGQQASIPSLVERYFAEANKDMISAIEKAIILIETRYSDADGRGKTLCGEILKRDEKEQVQLISVLGKISGSAACQFVLSQLQNGKPAFKEAAFKALCNWSDTSLAEDLYKVASSKDDPRAATASRAYIRIVTLNENGRNDKQKLAYVEKAMSVAKSDEDKVFLLSRLDQSRCPEVFRFAVKYIDDSVLEQAVYKAVVDLANDTGFHTGNRQEIEPYLDKVIEKSKDRSHVERAKRYKERR